MPKRTFRPNRRKRSKKHGFPHPQARRSQGVCHAAGPKGRKRVAVIGFAGDAISGRSRWYTQVIMSERSGQV
jgi:hypothetical protein